MSDFTDDDDALLAELGVEVDNKKTTALTPREERVIAGFEEVQCFVKDHGHLPRHGSGHDIFERLYAVRLERLQQSEECRAVLAGLDRDGLLNGNGAVSTNPDDDMDDDALLAELGVDTAGPEITQLRHVRPNAEKRAAEDVAQRQKCADFERFKPLFDRVQNDIETGHRETRPFELKAEIQQNRFFIVNGQKAYVAEMGEISLTDQGRTDARLRVIFDNGTESNMLMRSLQRALNHDDAGRRITEPIAGPLFSGKAVEGDNSSGTIYVLRSKSDHPLVAANRNLVHKIGVTNMPVEKRIAGAHLQTTFLMANVDVVATYDLYNINRTKLENLIHRIFEPARLDIQIPDRFGRQVTAREWFMVPLFVIDDAVGKIKSRAITEYYFDVKAAALAKRST